MERFNDNAEAVEEFWKIIADGLLGMAMIFTFPLWYWYWKWNRDQKDSEYQQKIVERIVHLKMVGVPTEKVLAKLDEAAGEYLKEREFKKEQP